MKSMSTFTSEKSLRDRQHPRQTLDNPVVRVHNKAKRAHPAYAREPSERPSATVTRTKAEVGRRFTHE